MNFIQSTDESQIKEVLSHYKKFYLSIVIVCICVVLLFTVIIPQFQQYSDQQSKVAEVEERIATLKKNLQYITTVNEDQQGKDLQVTTQALPDEKDYAGILYAVRTASSRSGVGVGDFTFSVGELTAKNVITKSTPFISMNLNITGKPTAIGLFLSELAKLFPLSNVSEIHINNNFSNILVTFYYKSIPALKVNYTNPILPLSVTNQKLMDTLRGWQSDRPSFDVTAPIEASGAASPF